MTAEELAALHAKVSDAPWSIDSFAAQLDQSGSILAECTHAFALGRLTLDEAELLQIATDPAHQRQGLGRLVLNDFEDQAKARGCTRLLLEVAANNAPAFALYSSTGWQQDGVRTKYYRLKNGQYDDALLMSKSI